MIAGALYSVPGGKSRKLRQKFTWKLCVEELRNRTGGISIGNSDQIIVNTILEALRVFP